VNSFLQCCFCCLLGVFLTAAASAEPTLPVPPQQNAPWTPPVGLPAPLVSAATTLFAEGLADPRGGEYRQISVHIGNVWSGDGGIVSVHGWVLPQPAAGQRYAVCWNGLVYPVVSLNDRADLSADVAALVKADADIRANYLKGNPTQPYFRFLQGAIPESQSVSQTSLLPLKAALLLRLGEGELAQHFWESWQAGTPPNYNDNTEALRDPYLLMADEWVWAQFDRAVTAHMRGDDHLSLFSARQLTALQPVAEAEAQRRGYQQSPSRGVHQARQPYFPYLEPLPRLLADEERRVTETTPPPALAALQAMPDKTTRIAALIRSLDQVAARQDGQPGSVSPEADPIVQALIGQGDDAVQPLIDTVRDDTRLTRSVGFGRDFFQDRYLISVSRTAYDAAEDILHTSEFGATGLPSDKAANAAALQAYWDKYKNLSVTERWYHTLADDKAAPAQWIDAAHEIVRPSDEVLRGGWIERGPHFTGNAAPKGEPLRQGHTPTVSVLMAQRIHTLRTYSNAPHGDSRQYNDVENATTLALYFAAWDPQAARPVLHDQFFAQRKALDQWPSYSYDTLYLTKLTLARMHSDDPAALGNYVNWLQGAVPKDLPLFSLNDLFEPLWRAPNDPAAQREAEYLFLNPHSPWVPFVHDQPGYSSDLFEEDLEGPLLLLPAFRQAMLVSLADRTVIKTVTLGGPDPQEGNYSVGSGLDPFAPATPQPFPVRRCDLYALHLSHLGGMPAFQYDWPTAKKDAAIAIAAARLRRHGGSFASDLPPVLPDILPGEGGEPQVPTPRLTFPHLTHPATAQDVIQNKAIFTFGSSATEKVRVWPLPVFPLPALWTADHHYPRHETVWTAPKKYDKVIGYAQEGFVWQAEETAKGRRFYGFVGPHDIARVPAEEMEFPPSNSYAWTQVAAGLDCALYDGSGQSVPYLTSLRAGQPLTLTLRLRSRRGVMQTLPADFLRHQVTLKLLFSPDAVGDEPRDPNDAGRTWEVVAPRQPMLAPPLPARKLEPAEEFSAWTLTPSRAFDLSRPGTYRLQFVFVSAATMTGRQTPEAAFRVTH